MTNIKTLTSQHINMDRVKLFNSIFNEDEIREVIKNYEIHDVYEFFKNEFEYLNKKDNLENLKSEQLELIKKDIKLRKYLTEYNICNISKYYYINDTIQKIEEKDIYKIKNDYVRLIKNNKILDELINYIFFDNKSDNKSRKKYNINITLNKEYNIVKELNTEICESLQIILKEIIPIYDNEDEEYYIKEILKLRLECLIKIQTIENI